MGMQTVHSTEYDAHCGHLIVTEDLDVDDRTMLKFILDKQCVDVH
jgi:hypothetical protein